jgi:L-lactate dehydrogenase
MAESRGTKVTIVGAGSVGATSAYACQIRGVAHTLAVYDVDAAKTRAEVLDLNHGAAFVPRGEVIGSADVGVTAGSDVVVITAGAKQKPGQSRLELAGANVRMMQSLMPQLVEQSPDAVFVVVTNPCDVVTMAAQKFSGLPTGRVFGSGTVLDSARFRYLLAQRIGVSPSNVHAYIAGEHGDSEIALWSSANVGAVPLKDWCPPGGSPIDEAARQEILHRTVNAAYDIIQGKGATWYAVGLAVARIVEAVLRREDRVLSVSSLLQDYHGISGVCLSVPSIVNHHGVEASLTVPMSESEIAGLRHSAARVAEAARSVGLV